MDPRPKLRGVTAPLLVTRGKCDYIASEVTGDQRDLMPNAVLVAINDAGRVISVDRPAIHRDLVRLFILDEQLPLESYTGTAEPRGRKEGDGEVLTGARATHVFA